MVGETESSDDEIEDRMGKTKEKGKGKGKGRKVDWVVVELTGVADPGEQVGEGDVLEVMSSGKKTCEESFRLTSIVPNRLLLYFILLSFLSSSPSSFRPDHLSSDSIQLYQSQQHPIHDSTLLLPLPLWLTFL